MIVAYLLIMCAAFFLIATSLIRLVGEYMFMQKIRAEKLIADGAARRMATAWNYTDADALFAATVQVAKDNDSRVLVLDLSGVVQADSASEYNGQYLAFAFQEVASVLKGESTTWGLYGLDNSSFLGRLGFFTGNTKDNLVGLYASPIMERDQLSGVLVLLTY